MNMFNKRQATLVLALVVILAIFVWVQSHGFIDITVSNASGTDYTYTVLDKEGNRVSSKKTKSPHFKKLLSKGTYHVLIESDGSEYRITKTKGFLSVTKMLAALKPESSREFVGNNPSFCMHYGQAILYSYNCSEPDDLAAHLPASADTPTITLSKEGGPIPLRGLVSLGGINKALLVREETEESGAAIHDIDSSLNVTNSVPLQGMDPMDADSITVYKTGFLVYSDSLLGLKYYGSPSSAPVTIKTTGPSAGTDEPVGLSVYGNSVGALFNSVGEGSDEGLSPGETPGGQPQGSSEFIFYEPVKKTYRFNKLYTSGGLCGDTKLCLINSGLLDVYDISRDEPRYIFGMKDVQKIFTIGEDMIIAATDKILALNQRDLVGSIRYSYGDNQYCGIDKTEAGFVVCVLNAKGGKVALSINTARLDTDSIDKKVFALLKDPNISDISTYKNYIYISPNLGQPVYSPTLDDYDYDPAIKQSAAKKINELIRRLNIDTMRYTIINPFQ